MLHGDAVRDMVGSKKRGFEFLEHLGETRIKSETRSKLTELGVCWPVDLHAIEQDLHVGKFVVVALALNKLAATGPEVFGVDAEDRK